MKRNLTFIITGCALALSNLTSMAEIARPVRATSSEVLQWQSQEKLAVKETVWGKDCQNVERFRNHIASPTKADALELAQWGSQNQEALEKVIATGESSVGRRIALFIPDRILDMLDIVSFNAGLGLGLAPEIHITRYFSIGIGAVAGLETGWLYNRNLMISPYYTVFSCLGPVQTYTIGFCGAGTGWEKGEPGSGPAVFTKAGIFSPDDEICQKGWCDPYGIGFGWGTEIHPIELADCLVGLLTAGLVDISGDDFANPERSSYKIGLPIQSTTSPWAGVSESRRGAAEQTQYLSAPRR